MNPSPNTKRWPTACSRFSNSDLEEMNEIRNSPYALFEAEEESRLLMPHNADAPLLSVKIPRGQQVANKSSVSPFPFSKSDRRVLFLFSRILSLELSLLLSPGGSCPALADDHPSISPLPSRTYSSQGGFCGCPILGFLIGCSCLAREKAESDAGVKTRPSSWTVHSALVHRRLCGLSLTLL